MKYQYRYGDLITKISSAAGDDFLSRLFEGEEGEILYLLIWTSYCNAANLQAPQHIVSCSLHSMPLGLLGAGTASLGWAAGLVKCWAWQLSNEALRPPSPSPATTPSAARYAGPIPASPAAFHFIAIDYNSNSRWACWALAPHGCAADGSVLAWQLVPGPPSQVTHTPCNNPVA